MQYFCLHSDSADVHPAGQYLRIICTTFAQHLHNVCTIFAQYLQNVCKLFAQHLMKYFPQIRRMFTRADKNKDGKLTQEVEANN